MQTLGFTLLVTFEDGSEQRVSGDQREMMRWEMEKQARSGDGFTNVPALWVRTMAFYALQRHGDLDRAATFDAWNATIPEVTVVASSGQSVDPGNPEASDEMPSSSRSGAGRASGKSASTGRRVTKPRS